MTAVRAVLGALPEVMFNAYTLNIHPCDDCKLCHARFACKHDDDMQTVLDALKKADTLVLATPVYFGAMTDMMMRIINRFQQLFEAKFTHKKPFTTIKKLIVISTAASEDPSMFDGVRLTTRLLEELFSVERVHTLLLGHTDMIKNVSQTYEREIEAFKNEIAH